MLWLMKFRRTSPKMYQRAMRSPFLCLIILLLTIIIVILLASPLQNVENRPKEFYKQEECAPSKSDLSPSINPYSNTTEMKPIIFIGGMPRSGTTLMRAILDAHPSVRCGEETRVIPRILSMKTSWKKSTTEWNRLSAGGITEAILDSAVRAFIYEILIQHGRRSDVLCDKDPFVLKYSADLSAMFPHAKFLLLIRDARAVLHSIMTRQVTITGFSLTDFRQNLKLWNQGIEKMVDQCLQLTQKKCMMVYYEQLVLQPKVTIQNILQFLNLSWVDEVLHHEELIGTRISLSKTEHSSDQVVKPINLEALTKWIGHMPNDVKKDLDTLAPMLKKLGYDTKAEVPTYGKADDLVLDNMNELKKNAALWDAKAKAYARQLPNQTRMATTAVNHQKPN